MYKISLYSLILTFAFLHLSPIERKRLVERHPVIESVVVHINEDSSDNVSISSTNNEDSPDNVSTSSKSSYAYKDSDDDNSIGTTDGPAIGCLEVYKPESESEPETEQNFIPLPEVEDFARVFTSGTQVCQQGEDPKDTLPILFRSVGSRVLTTHVGRRVYKSSLGSTLTGPVVPNQVGTIRRGDDWNGRPDPLKVGTPDPNYPEDFRSDDPNDYNLRPFAAAQPGSVSIPSTLGYNRSWDSRFPPPPYEIKRTLSDRLRREIVCAEIPFPWSDPNAQALIGEWGEDNLRRLEWCKVAKLVKENRLSFWRGYYARREKGLPVIRGCGSHW